VLLLHSIVTYIRKYTLHYNNPWFQCPSVNDNNLWSSGLLYVTANLVAIRRVCILTVTSKWQKPKFCQAWRTEIYPQILYAEEPFHRQ